MILFNFLGKRLSPKVVPAFYYILILWIIISIPGQNIKAQNFLTGDLIRVMSYNIRYAGDPQKEGADSWPQRKDKLHSS